MTIFLALTYYVSCLFFSGHAAGSEILIKEYAAADTMQVSMPVNRMIYQRNNKNVAYIMVKGTAPANALSIEARLVTVTIGGGVSTDWVRIADKVKGGSFSGRLKARGGWYKLEVRAMNGKQLVASSTVEKVGVGEVFLVIGHSVAQGGEINIEGSADDRVNTVPLEEKSEQFQTYLKTGDPQYLPELRFVQAASGVAHAPFGHHSYFWSKFGELVARKENVPVLIFNAGFGGTSLEHWAKSSQNVQFEHGFVRSAIWMPYINIKNAYIRYIYFTGLRCILSDNGQNDSGQKNADSIVNNYRIVIRQARQDLAHPVLAVVVNRQTPLSAPAIRLAQDRMTKDPYCFPGPDYDTMLKDDRVDGIHLSAAGCARAAVMWEQSLSPEFFKVSRPWLPVN